MKAKEKKMSNGESLHYVGQGNLTRTAIRLTRIDVSGQLCRTLVDLSNNMLSKIN